MNKKIAASAAALVALGVASGTAFTASNGVLDTKAVGFSEAGVSGATVSTVKFNYSANGEILQTADLTFVADELEVGEVIVMTFDSLSAADIVTRVEVAEGTITSGQATSVTITPSSTVSTADVGGYSIAVVDGSDYPAA